MGILSIDIEWIKCVPAPWAYLPVNTTFPGNYPVIPTALSLTSFFQKCANPDSYR